MSCVLGMRGRKADGARESRFHSENSVLTTIVRRFRSPSSSSLTLVQFSLVFWDILFTPIDGVFETAYQSAPLDLRTDAFCIGQSRPRNVISSLTSLDRSPTLAHQSSYRCGREWQSRVVPLESRRSRACEAYVLRRGQLGQVLEGGLARDRRGAS